jgi:uncharacterized NAD(P)/FAD-binding protein YdhS
MPETPRVLLLGSPGETAKGLAYATTAPEHTLNVRAGRMSLIRDDPDHFVRWLARGGLVPDGADPAQHFAPRQTYGRYVEDTLRHALSASGGRISVREEKASRLVREGAAFAVGTSGGRGIRASSVVLCIGHGPPSFPLPPGAIPAAAAGRMITDPWTDPRMGAIAPGDRILFIGASQTMADQAVGLDAAGHRGEMVAVSRHGQLPASQLLHQTEPRAVLIDRRTLRGLFRTVVAAGRDEAREGGDWRAVIDGLRPLSQELWEGLSFDERRRFIRHAEAAWLTHRSRLAAAVGARIDALRAAGRLTIRAARLDGVVPADGRLGARLRIRGTGRIEVDSFDWIINCSGVGRLRPDAMEPLLAQMLADGIVRIHALGRGLDIRADHTAIDTTDAPVEGLRVLGPLAGGHFFESIAVPEIAEHSATLAAALTRAASRPVDG